MGYGDVLAHIAKGVQIGDDQIAGIPLGLNRAGGLRGAELSYVFTNPPPRTEITPGDSLYVLAQFDFQKLLDDDDFLTAEGWTPGARKEKALDLAGVTPANLKVEV